MPEVTDNKDTALTSPLMRDNARSTELRLMYEISKLLGSSLILSKTLRGVMNLLAVNLDIWRGMLCLESETGELRVVDAIGITLEKLREERYRAGEGVTGRIYKSGTPAVIPDIAEEPLFLNRLGSMNEAENQPIAFIGVPVKVGFVTYGVLSIMRVMHDRAKHSFDHDVRLLTMIANLIGQAVKLHRTISAERNQLVEEKQILMRALHRKYSIDNVIGVSKAMQEVFAEVHQSAPSKSTVLLRGESGTGKEVIARAIHFLSTRKDGPFIKVNCAALSETLLESELFGHEKGAFTGAHAERKGRFELANGGTLFLDEIGDISPAFQAKLLRVLQEREFERVGGTRSIKVNVRLIAATDRNLEEAVSKGEFRADLYYRINVVSIFIPALRDRREDIPLLVNYFLENFNRENRRRMSITQEALNKLVQCGWPGNVRELENCIERTATMTRGNVIGDADILCHHNRCMGHITQHPAEVSKAPPSAYEHPSHSDKKVIPIVDDTPQPVSESAKHGERERLIWALEQCGWVQAKAARLLKLTPRQIAYAMQKHHIEVRKF